MVWFSSILSFFLGWFFKMYLFIYLKQNSLIYLLYWVPLMPWYHVKSINYNNSKKRSTRIIIGKSVLISRSENICQDLILYIIHSIWYWMKSNIYKTKTTLFLTIFFFFLRLLLFFKIIVDIWISSWLKITTNDEGWLLPFYLCIH